MAERTETLYYETLPDGRVKCTLCPHECVIKKGCVGVCHQRANVEGHLETQIYGRVSSIALDPVEKKPLYHFHPGKMILSMGTTGCNFGCLHCQNWEISKEDAPTRSVTPVEAVAIAKEHNSFGIAYTYNEPLIWYEYVLDTAIAAREAGLKNVLVTNGFLQEEPFRALVKLIDALNIDIKSIRDEFYRNTCKGWIEPVLRNTKIANEVSHVEITNLIIPEHNDSEEDLTDLADWILQNLGSDTPTHLSAYFPAYKLTAPPTSPETLERAWNIFSKRLNYVYVGNMRIGHGSDTVCKKCGETVIKRQGYRINIEGLNGDKCAKCGNDLNIIV